MLAGLLLVGAFAGAVYELIWYPLRSFVALRTEARDLLTLHSDARKSTSPIDTITHYNEIGLRLLTFDQQHQVAAPLMGSARLLRAFLLACWIFRAPEQRCGARSEAFEWQPGASISCASA